MPRLLLAVLIWCAGCTAAADDTMRIVDTGAPDTGAPDTVQESEASRAATPPNPTGARVRLLSPLEDSIADRMTFVPATEQRFLAAVRRRRLLVDVGRVDIEVRRDSARATAFRRLAAERSPLPVGTRLRLRGVWGSDDAVVRDYDTWNGRIVATLELPPRVDSIARGEETLVASAVRTDSAKAPVDAGCARPVLDSAGESRAAALRDSLEQSMRVANVPPYARLVQSLRLRQGRALGCFGDSATRARLVVVISMWAGNHEWVRERAFLVPDSGSVVPLVVNDFRFKAHEVVGVFDADGDGVDDLVARGSAEGIGGTVILRLAFGEKRLERLASGFAWESR
jgi:hypothetical protein